DILNHVFDDVESFVSKLQKSAEAARVLEHRERGRRTRRRESGGEGRPVGRASEECAQLESGLDSEAGGPLVGISAGIAPGGGTPIYPRVLQRLGAPGRRPAGPPLGGPSREAAAARAAAQAAKRPPDRCQRVGEVVTWPGAGAGAGRGGGGAGRAEQGGRGLGPDFWV
ncbi:PREDICTED: alanine and glycine-rich protein-like, partial [Myotis brandtii]|uniref:alanine and glycine-rich protein-like n=1 Tax=Myotis brandtii TaxID=109478 RepID=UPI0007046681